MTLRSAEGKREKCCSPSRLASRALAASRESDVIFSAAHAAVCTLPGIAERHVQRYLLEGCVGGICRSVYGNVPFMRRGIFLFLIYNVENQNCAGGEYNNTYKTL